MVIRAGQAIVRYALTTPPAQWVCRPRKVVRSVTFGGGSLSAAPAARPVWPASASVGVEFAVVQDWQEMFVVQDQSAGRLRRPFPGAVQRPAERCGFGRWRA